MTTSTLRRALGALAAICGLTLLGSPAAGAATRFPSRPIHLIVGFAAGGSADTVARLMAPILNRELKQNIIIENRPGAGGNIASADLLKSASDGYTIMLGTIGSLAVNQHISKLKYDPVTDMEAISLAVKFSNVLVVNPHSDIHTLADYVREAKAPHSSLSFGSSGIGSSGHLAGELLKSVAGLNNQHIAYRGGAPAMNDLLGGRLGAIFASPTDAVQFIAAGKLRAIATTGLSRMDVLPHVPTVAESGYPGFEANNWYAYVAPAKTPADVIRVLNKAIVVALKDPGVSAKLEKLGLQPAPSTPAETAAYIRSESKKWGDLVKKIGISAD